MTQNGKYASRESLRARSLTRRFDTFVYDGETYRLRSLNDLEFQRIAKPEGTDEIAVIQQVVCDENGNPVYTPDDREVWEVQDAALVQSLASACLRHVQAPSGEAAKND